VDLTAIITEVPLVAVAHQVDLTQEALNKFGKMPQFTTIIYSILTLYPMEEAVVVAVVEAAAAAAAAATKTRIKTTKKKNFVFQFSPIFLSN
jgi:hypothetical protein